MDSKTGNDPSPDKNRADLSISKIFSAGHKKLAKKKTPHTFELEQEMINAGYCDLKKNKVVKFAKNRLGSEIRIDIFDVKVQMTFSHLLVL